MNGESVSQLWTEILQLPGFVVVHSEDDRLHHRYFITVVPEHPIGVCPQCPRTTETIKQRRTRERILDLPIGSHAVELTVRMGQFECSHCGHCFTPPIPFLAQGSHATERLLGRAELIRHSDVANAARFFGIPEETLEGWYYAFIERHQQRATEAPGTVRCIGIDELSLLREEFPKLGQLWEQRERLRGIFEDARIGNAVEGRKQLEQWMVDVAQLGLSALDTFCKTLSNGMDRIANYFHRRSSNGRTEGFKHGLRAILWRAYGMLNFKNFRLRVLDRFGKVKV